MLSGGIAAGASHRESGVGGVCAGEDGLRVEGRTDAAKLVGDRIPYRSQPEPDGCVRAKVDVAVDFLLCVDVRGGVEFYFRVLIDDREEGD